MKPTYTPPDNGGFMIPRCSDRVILAFVNEKDRWEILGGGEEPEDNGDLLNTAIRESQEEGMLTVERNHARHVGNLVQVIPGTGGKTGIAAVWSTQIFEPISGLKWKEFQLFRKTDPAYNKETGGVSMIRLKDIFCEGSPFAIPLGHKRMILHMLNVETDFGKPLIEGIRLGQPVTALVPHLGIITC
ncbi:MAG: hypothetical protein FGM57_00355 [Candidatus Taylorbacteria bacterium]|nr:hypothetical protein [Candidatus Taylorbacteria bacterium]